uniref:Ubiquitin-like protease family profile domain-containing protein n=1 Tax=Fagus sylvatica TaxID=28930 RepID=A0A2N9FNS4_FAGSY
MDTDAALSTQALPGHADDASTHPHMKRGHPGSTNDNAMKSHKKKKKNVPKVSEKLWRTTKWKTLPSEAQAPFIDQAKKLAEVYKEKQRSEVPVEEIDVVRDLRSRCLRNSGPPVSDSGVFQDIEPLCKRHGFMGTELVTLGNIEAALAASDVVVDGGFKQKVVLFLLATVFCPTTSLNIPRTYLHVVKDIDRVSEYNWALFVFNKLRDAVLAFKYYSMSKFMMGFILYRCHCVQPLGLVCGQIKEWAKLNRLLKRLGGYSKAELIPDTVEHQDVVQQVQKKGKEIDVIDHGSNKEHRSSVENDANMGTHTNENNIILKELSEDVKSMKVALSTISEGVTTMRGEYQSLTKAIGNIISEGLNRMKSEILQGIAKGTIDLEGIAKGTIESVLKSVPKSVPKSSSDCDSMSERDKNLGAVINKMVDFLGCGTPNPAPEKPITVVQVVDSVDQTLVKGRRKKGAEEAVRRQPARKAVNLDANQPPHKLKSLSSREASSNMSEVIDYVASQLATREKARSGGEMRTWYLPTTFAVKALKDFMLHPKVTPTANFEDLNMTSWTLVIPPAVPIQSDGSGCGIYVIQFMRLPILSPHYQSVTATDADRLNIVLELVLDDSNQLKTEVIAKAESFRTANLIT